MTYTSCKRRRRRRRRPSLDSGGAGGGGGVHPFGFFTCMYMSWFIYDVMHWLGLGRRRRPSLLLPYIDCLTVVVVTPRRRGF